MTNYLKKKSNRFLSFLPHFYIRKTPIQWAKWETSRITFSIDLLLIHVEREKNPPQTNQKEHPALVHGHGIYAFIKKISFCNKFFPKAIFQKPNIPVYVFPHSILEFLFPLLTHLQHTSLFLLSRLLVAVTFTPPSPFIRSGLVGIEEEWLGLLNNWIRFNSAAEWPAGMRGQGWGKRRGLKANQRQVGE
jgi:hypothetical protein